MKRLLGIVGAAALCATAAAPVQAAWTLVRQAAPVKIAKSRLTVTPSEDWNRDAFRPIKQGELWTRDGGGLNELYFVSGLSAGETLFKDFDPKNNPLPKFAGSMSLADIPDFYESSSRVAMRTSLFTIDTVEPIRFAGRPGIKFTFDYALRSSPVTRKGIAAATLVDGQLHMITFVAPSIHYFERDKAKAEAIIASATL